MTKTSEIERLKIMLDAYIYVRESVCSFKTTSELDAAIARII